MELAAGMFALTLVVSALCVFAIYIARSLRVQNSLRSSAPQPNVTIRLDAFAELNFAGRGSLKMDERVVMPLTSIAK